MLSGQTTSVEWFVVGNLDKKGFDVSKKVKINVI